MKACSIVFLLLFQFPFATHETLEFLASSPITESHLKLNGNKPGAMNIVFKSTDGGQTWEDISEGLPEILQENVFFATDSGLYLNAGYGIYHSKPTSTAPFWKKEFFPNDHSALAVCKNGI